MMMQNDNEQSVSDQPTPEVQPVLETTTPPEPVLSTETNPLVTTPTVTEPKVESPKKPRKTFIVVLIIISVLLLLAAGGVTAYLLFFNKTNDTTSVTNQDSTTQIASTPTKLTAESLVTKSKTDLKGEIKLTLLDTDSKPYNVYSAPVFRPADYNFSVSPSTDYGFGSYGTEAVITADLATIKAVLKDNKLTETAHDATLTDSVYAGTFTSDDITCSLTQTKPYPATANSKDHSVIFGCADITDYSKPAASLKPYFDVYAKQSPYDTSTTFMGAPKVTQSQTSGYSTTVISIGGSEYGSVGGFAGLFYTTPDKVIHYFTGTQSEVPCADFNTDDLKKAYVGQACYGTDGLSTVKL